MYLDPLATESDLPASVDVSDLTLVRQKLAAASDAVRDAAGSPISLATSTVKVGAPSGQWLQLPAQPVRSVSAVSIDGVAVTDWALIDGALYRAAGWSCLPAVVEITFTSGFDPVPADVIDLVCQFAIAGLLTANDGARTGLAYESIDDYRVGYQQGGEATASAMEVPARTRQMLRSRFGVGGSYVTGSR